MKTREEWQRDYDDGKEFRDRAAAGMLRDWKSSDEDYEARIFALELALKSPPELVDYMSDSGIPFVHFVRGGCLHRFRGTVETALTFGRSWLRRMQLLERARKNLENENAAAEKVALGEFDEFYGDKIGGE